MALRMRKSINLGGGVRLNASKTGIGLSAGTRGARYSVHSSGRRTSSVGIPGTGVGYVKSSTSGRKRQPARQPAPPPPPPPKPGLLAPGYEKAFHKAIHAYVGGDVRGALTLFRDASSKDTDERALSDDFFAGLLSAQIEDDASAIYFLEKVVRSSQPLPDALMDKYVSGGGIGVPVTSSVSVDVPFGSLAAALTLAEVYQRQDRRDEAIGLLQQLIEVNPDPSLKLSLCDLYAEAEAWDEIVELAAGTTNEDDASCQVRIYQARAFEAQGMNDAALEAYKDALRSKKREPELLREARYSKGKLLIAAGKKAMGRKELEKVYADDPNFRDVKDLLAQASATG